MKENPRATTQRICITINKDVLAAVNAERKMIPLSTYINDILFYATASEEQLQGLGNFSQK